MAAITERGGRYQARVRRDGFKTVSKTFIRKADAMAWARRTEADMEGGRWIDEADKVPTFAAALTEYRTQVASKLKGADDYAYRFDKWAREPFAGKPIDEVTARELSAWRDRQAEGRKPATVVRQLAAMSALFSWAMKEQGWLTANPLALVSRPRVSDSRDRTLSDEDMVYLTRAAESSKAKWLAPALVVLYRSAMRRGELAGLKRGDVDYSASTLYLADTKAGVPRTVPLDPRALDALRDLDRQAVVRRRVAGLDDDGAADLLLPIGEAGSISTRFTVTVRRARAMYVRDCEARGQKPAADVLQNLRLHDLRHHAVSGWAATGALSLIELMAVSGHSNPRMLARYTHMKAPALAAKLAKISSEVAP